MTVEAGSMQPLPFVAGEPRHHAGLTLVPLFPAAEPRVAYVGLDEALARGLAVAELPADAAVGMVEVRNPLAEAVLLYEGEELVGAKQNRVVRVTTLVEAHAEVLLAVDCVERGRWAWRMRGFESAPRAAYPALRSYAAAFPRSTGQAGALAGVGGEVACLDFVLRPDVFAGLYGKLLRGYALDALEAEDRRLGREDAQRFLDSLGTSASFLSAQAGTGTARRFAGDVVGTELAAFGEVVALSAFPGPAPGLGAMSGSVSVWSRAPPSRRRTSSAVSG